MSEGRLRALRMVGFKSFADRTSVEFGPGISCIIGPNGSGKSNLVDALRWTLGEQGRSLRTRRAEDLIFAGSSSRRAVGMADVTLVIDNQDRLLPVDYAEIELGRRLFRSGENEYLLNHQRVRLRDLVDLLDEANLADNAFLFIGQGMVDQALALRPEERRPLFEEAAGIRRHERRRRAAEAALTEAEANVERVRDVLAELRPQARRLAAQAEQQQQRRTAGTDLAAALVVLGQGRLVAAERDADRHHLATSAARAEADAALRALRDAEENARALSIGLGERADQERDLRVRMDAARARTLEQRLLEARLASDSEALGRERARLEAERQRLEARIEEARRVASVPLPEPDVAAERALRESEEALAAAMTEVEAIRAGTAVEAEQHARSLAARRLQQEELRRARYRHEELARQLAGLERETAAASQRLAQLRDATVAAADAARRAAQEEESAETVAERARVTSAASDAGAAETTSRHASAAATLDGLDARLGALQSRLDAAVDQDAYRAARRRGGQLIAEGLDVETGLRTAIEAALGDALRGLAVDPEAALALRDRRATLLLPELPGRAGRGLERDAARLGAAVSAAGGGPLSAGIRRDPAGHVTRLLVRTHWVEDLETALTLRPQLAPGWRLVTRTGEVVTEDGLVRVGPPISQLQQQAELRMLESERVRQAESMARLAAARAEAEIARDMASRALAEARARLDEARRARRIGEERERSAGRASEAAAREGAWQESVLQRSREQVVAATAELQRLEREAATATPMPESDAAGAPDRQVATLAARVRSLEATRDERVAVLAASNRQRAAAEEAQRRSQIGIAMDERRLGELAADSDRTVGAEADLAAQRERLASALAGAIAAEDELGRQLQSLLDAGRDERARLAAAEAQAASARERLRAAETRGRTSEVAEMEARLRVDGARESLLVELAGIGPDGLGALRRSIAGDALQPIGADPMPGAVSAEELGPALESTLDECLSIWRAQPAPEPPSAGRLASLRRRYHELGASNPFAATEFAEIRERLETLDAQRNDLDLAIRSTRELIGNLNSLIAEQFRRTFAQLEGAFARRFHQLFDGGDAHLSLTVPDDLAITGVEIMARPPGKKRQPLAMLSGGERTLTAVALLLAMLEVRPVPFCVLDEVDAALDEANVGRFSAALRDLASTIQFVVITHNRGTIEAADALYGVTVGDDAVSRVISMRLDGRPMTPQRNGHAPEPGESELVAVGPGS